MNEVSTNIFEDAFISVMNILQARGHVLFEAIVTNVDAQAKYPMNRVWRDLADLTIAWHIHQPLYDEDGEEILEEEVYDEEVIESSDSEANELNELHLEDDRYESAFGGLMLLLDANNSPLFEQIRESVSVDDSDVYKQDPEIIKLGYAWKVWCNQNVCKSDDYNLFKPYTREENDK